MNKTMMIMMNAIAFGIFAAMAQELPVPAGLPTPASTDIPSISQLDVGSMPLEEYAEGGLCRTYCHPKYNRLVSPFRRERNMLSALISFLESANFLDQGYDKSNLRFDGCSVALKGHPHNVVTWEGFLDAPVSEEYHFVVTSDDPYKVTINGKTLQGYGQNVLNVKMMKGASNKIYIAHGSCNSLLIQYTLVRYPNAPTYTLFPNALKHIVK